MSGDELRTIASIKGVMQHVHHLLRDAPFRKSGSGQDTRAARYVVDSLSSYGLDAYLEEFETFDSDPGDATLELLGPERHEIEVRACAHVEATPAEGYIGEIIDVGAGSEDDYRNKDVRGKAVLAEVSYAPATPEKARIAASAGAAGIILMNWGRGDEPGIPWRALKAVWGNPTPETWHKIPRLFGASISRRDGETIRRLMARGKVEVRATVTAKREWRVLCQPIAWLHAPQVSPESEQFVIVSGHLDSWAPGVTDNISGNALMMEVARTLAARRDQLRRSVVFCFWNGHEVAEAAGSAYFVDAHWERINRDAVAYLNIDSVGMRGTTLFNVACCPELTDFIRASAAGTVGNTVPVEFSSLDRVGDQSFFGVGVSAATGRHGFTPETVAAYNGATLGWYNHTEYDTLDELDESVLERDLRYWVAVTHELATTRVLPHRFVHRVDDLKRRVKLLLDTRSDPAGLAAILPVIEALEYQIVWFDSHMERLVSDARTSEASVVRANNAALRLARLLTFISGSAAGKYEQDSYGMTTLNRPIPLLSAYDDYCAAEPHGLVAKLTVTKLMRLRHVVTDALQGATDVVKDLRSSVQAPAMSDTI
jgi:hypothetical protein